MNAKQEENTTETNKESTGIFKIIVIISLACIVIWSYLTSNSEEMVSSPKNFYKGKENCLNAMINNPSQTPFEISECQIYQLAKFKIAANLTDKEILEFFNEALESGIAPKEIEDEVSEFYTSFIKLSENGDEESKVFISKMEKDGNFKKDAQLIDYINDLRKKADDGDEKSKRALDTFAMKWYL